MHDTLRTRPARRLSLSALLLASALGAGCAMPPPAPTVSAEQVADFTRNYPSELERLYRQVPLQGPRNAALNHMRAGLAALELGHLDAAASSFDEVLKTIEAIYAENPEAERARSVWYAESVKDFKGEPYERAMAYYYRGLVYLMQGDYQNARASFRGGLLQDTFMEANERMTSDFGALAYLEGWAGRCAAFDPGTVADSFREARERNGSLDAPHAEDRLLVLFETGSAPVKTTAGNRNEVLTFGPGALPPLSEATANLRGRNATMVQAEDIFFQANTRSGRQVDSINSGKVEYKEGTETAGRVARAAGAGLLVGAALTNNRRAAGAMGAAGGILLLAGLAADAAANAMKTEADARQWDNLPGNILLAALRRPPAPARNAPPPVAEVTLNRDGKQDVRSLVVRGAGPCSIAWGREVPATNVPDMAPKTATR